MPTNTERFAGQLLAGPPRGGCSSADGLQRGLQLARRMGPLFPQLEPLEACEMRTRDFWIGFVVGCCAEALWLWASGLLAI